MWSYNQTIPSDELYHYGVPGMKWGHRKKYYNSDGSLNSTGKAKQNYKNAKSELKKASKAAKKAYGPLGLKSYGVKGIERTKKASDKMVDAEVKVVNAKAKYNASKAKNDKKAKKAEFNTFVKEMGKSGLAGSAADTQSDGRSTKIYNQLKAEKGKEYADRVQKKVQNQKIATLATSATVAVGATIVSAMLNARNQF